MRVGIVGAGITGLDLGYRLSRRGHKVTLFEKDSRPGGLAGSFELRGRRIEKFYHFICRPDLAYLERLEELGVGDRVRWRSTRMSYYLRGRLRDFSTPWALLGLGELGLGSKLRYGLNVLRSRLRKDWRDLEDVSAEAWLRDEIGDEAYELLWSNLMRLKFHEHASSISAAWLWTRIRRVSASRRWMLNETLGYVEGGSDVIVGRLAAAILERGGRILTGRPVIGLVVRDSRVEGVLTRDGKQCFDAVVSTAPLPVVAGWSELPAELRASYGRIANIGVICSILVLDAPLTNAFWTNINDESIPLAGFIEYTTLNPMGGLHVLYVPEYLPAHHERFNLPARRLIAEHVRSVGRVVPGFDDRRVLDAHVHRSELSQPICTTGFLRRLPAPRTPLGGFYAADTSHFYPEDRTIAESIKLAGRLEELLVEDGGT